MLFNSPEFIFVFLPATVIAFHALRHAGRPIAALAALMAASLLFYTWWNPPYVLLLGLSVLVNYAFGGMIVVQASNARVQGLIVAVGVAANLLLLCYYKYLGFFISIFRDLTAQSSPAVEIALPLGISFFTFTQISYLIDLRLGRTRSEGLLSYALFVTFFPHLIAGPIVHHRELAQQFAPASRARFDWTDFALGVTVFTAGLFKKVVIADNLALFANPAFAAAAAGDRLDLLSAWGGALAYTFQLYFDFSGYSDMAIGLALLFGIRLPINFLSPYRARSIIEFWRRWHITLSHYLRDYLYIPLGGNRHGYARQLLALIVTMFLGGLWHGAGWTFVLWGLGHGVLLLVNHLWRSVTPANGAVRALFAGCFGWVLTFGAVSVLWVLFRASDLATAARYLKAMFDPTNVTLPGFVLSRVGDAAPVFLNWGWRFDQDTVRLYTSSEFIIIFGCLAAVLLLPNVYEFFNRYRPALDIKGVTVLAAWVTWRPNFAWSLLFAAAFSYAALETLIGISEFLYFRF